MTKKIGTTEARQGETPHIVRYVLAISTVAAVVALAIVGVVMMTVVVAVAVHVLDGWMSMLVRVHPTE